MVGDNCQASCHLGASTETRMRERAEKDHAKEYEWGTNSCYNPSQPRAARGTDPSRPGLGNGKLSCWAQREGGPIVLVVIGQSCMRGSHTTAEQHGR